MLTVNQNIYTKFQQKAAEERERRLQIVRRIGVTLP